jgi:hypothetical protein
MPPKNGEIALLLATNRGCVVKYVSQKRNESNNKYQDLFSAIRIFLLRVHSVFLCVYSVLKEQHSQVY